MFSRLVSVSRVSNTLTRKFHVTAMAPINVGDKVLDSKSYSYQLSSP